MRLVLLGPPGVGKGTQAIRLAAAIGGRHIAAGDLVREEIAAGTALGHTLQGYSDRGELVPDATIIALILPQLAPIAAYILDGFPRDEPQARALDAALAAGGTHLDRVIALQASDAELIDRLSARRLSQATGRTYNLRFDPPPSDDPGPFIERADDHPEEIARRLRIYHQSTEPLLAYYSQRGLLLPVDASGQIEVVQQRVQGALWESGSGAAAP